MNWIKRKISKYLLKNVLCAILPEEIIKVDRGIVYIGSDKITEQEVRQLQAEIKALEGSRIWKVLNETVRFHAVHKSVHDATSFEHVLSGKMALWTLDIFQSTMNVLKKIELKS